MYGINLNPVLPVRTEPKEQSEMCTQLLFGEVFIIQERTEKWSLILNEKDRYTGWVDRKMITSITTGEYAAVLQTNSVQIFSPVANCWIENKQTPIMLPAGSYLHHYSFEDGLAHIAHNTYKVSVDAITKRGEKPPSGHLITSVAQSFINAPYLWGGKTILGIDCSGLVQLAFNICGIQLPRDAGQQVKEGRAVAELQQVEAGDLAFFENEKGNITHVGILLSPTTILHASGRVKTENIDNKGIISETDGSYTHKLNVIKRII